MKSELYKLFNFDYNHLYKRENNEAHDYITELYRQFLPDEMSILLEEWRLKNILLKGITFNNIHLITNNDVYKNALQCLVKRDSLNKNIVNKPTTLYLYYDDEHFNFDEIKKLDTINFDRKVIYMNNYDLVGNIGEYLQAHNYEIVYMINNIEEIFGNKKNIFVIINDENINDLHYMIERLSQAHTQNLYCNLLTTNQQTIIQYYKILKENSQCLHDVNYLLGEHIGIDKENCMYMKMNDINVYETNENTFQDFYVSHSYLSKHCMGCDNKIFCIAHTLEENCRWRKI